MSNNFEQFPDLEILELRKQVQELETKLAQAQAVLREHDLLDAKAHISNEELVALKQIEKFKELSDKNIPFQTEDFKNFEVVVKTLLAIRGKAVVEEKKKKSTEKPDLAKLLQIAGDKKFERND